MGTLRENQRSGGTPDRSPPPCTCWRAPRDARQKRKAAPVEERAPSARAPPTRDEPRVVDNDAGAAFRNASGANVSRRRFDSFARNICGRARGSASRVRTRASDPRCPRRRPAAPIAPRGATPCAARRRPFPRGSPFRSALPDERGRERASSIDGSRGGSFRRRRRGGGAPTRGGDPRGPRGDAAVDAHHGMSLDDLRAELVAIASPKVSTRWTRRWRRSGRVETTGSSDVRANARRRCVARSPSTVSDRLRNTDSRESPSSIRSSTRSRPPCATTRGRGRAAGDDGARARRVRRRRRRRGGAKTTRRRETSDD